MLEEFGDIYNRLKAGMWVSDNADGEQIMVVLLMMILKVSDVNKVKVV